MRLISLKMQAFGPFVGEEIIEFERFGDHSLFLINGVTGAGKSTILDAVCFALYGVSSGQERNPEDMRCHLPSVSLITEVTLEFALHKKRYKITRRPKQFRARKRGEGVTPQSPEAQLWRFNGEGSNDQGELLVAKKTTEVDAFVHDLIGLTKQQFTQVVVLPQGKFRRLLKADSSAREMIFQNLFRTQRYRDIEKKLKDKANDIVAKVKEIDSRINALLLEAEVKSDVDSSASLEQINAVLQQQLTVQIEQQQWQTKELDNTRRQALAERDRMQGRQQEGQLLLQQFDALDERKQALQRIEQSDKEVDHKEAAYQQSLKARAITPDFSAWQNSETAYLGCQQSLSQAQESLVQAEQGLQQHGEIFEQAKQAYAQLDDLKQRHHDLQRFRAIHIQLFEVQKNVQETDAQLNQQTLLCESHERSLASLNQQAVNFKNELNELDQQLEVYADVHIRVQELNRQLDQRNKLERLRHEYQGLQQALLEKQGHHTQLYEQHQAAQILTKSTEMQWHSSQAMLLARELADGSPCMVCGSLEHPNKAVSSDAVIVNKEQLDHVRDAEAMACRAMNEAAECLQTQQNLVEQNLATGKALAEQLGDLAVLSLSVLQEQATQVNEELAALDEKRLKKAAVSQQLGELDKQIPQITQTLEHATAQRQEQETQLTKVKAELDQKLTQIPHDYRQLELLEEGLKTLGERIEAIQQHYDQAQQKDEQHRANHLKASEQQHNQQALLNKAEQQRRHCQNVWLNTLEHSVFDSVQAYQAAQLSETDEEALYHQIQQHKKHKDEINGAIIELNAVLHSKQRPNMTALAEQLTEATQTYQELESQWSQAEVRYKTLNNAALTIEKHRQERKQWDKKYAIYGTLHLAANGIDDEKVSLHRFVLSVLLDDVLNQASNHLYRMSYGRYRLLRNTEKAGRNKASGLDLLIQDDNSGTTRPTETLSGGESFLASLALALGLSEVIEAHAGGIQLNTLFIDEGFGQLDTDTLEMAIHTLIQLRDTGRTIGVISHVTELKEQMDKRIDVIKAREGSGIQLVC